MKKVLIVEDDPIVASLLQSALEKERKFKVCGVVKNGKEALPLITNGAYDLLLLDVYMPEMTGIELLRKLRGKGISTCVIMITAASEVTMIEQAVACGVIDYIVKTSFGIERLKVALERFLLYQDAVKQGGQMTQAELDKLLHRQLQRGITVELDKGMEVITLQKIWQALQCYENNSFSTEAIADETGISKVTIRRYLEFMVKIGALSKDLIYAKIGRPVFSYMIMSNGSQVLERWLRK